MSDRNRTRLTDAEIAYLTASTLGRLATVAPDGAPQNNPVSCYYNASTATIDIGGHSMSSSRKYRNVQTNPHVALVVDDMIGADPARIRCLEIRGVARSIPDPGDSAARTPGSIIRIHPRRIVSWGIGPSRTAAAPP